MKSKESTVNWSETEEGRRAMQQYARHCALNKLLAEIVFDMNVCKLEGWKITEFPEMIKEEIDNIVKKMVRQPEEKRK